MKAQKSTSYFTCKKTAIIFCLLLVTSIAFWACRKQDYPTKQNEELIILTNKVHKWYDSSLSSKNVLPNNQIATLSTNSNTSEPDLNITNLYWDSSYIHYDSVDRKGLTVPIYTNKATGEFIQLATINYSGKTKGFLIKTIPDSIWYSHNKNAKNYSSADGKTYIYSVTGKFLAKAIFKNGDIVKDINSTNSGKPNIGNIATFGFDDPQQLQEVTVSSSKNNYTYGNSFYFYIIGGGGSENQEIVPYQPEGGGGSGSSGNPSAPTNNADSIIDKLDSFPCAQDVLRQMPNCNNEVKTILQNIFGVNADINITFQPNSSLPDGIAGLSSRANGSLVNYQAVVDLNPKYLTGSQDYIAATLIHESLHAYIDYQRKVLDTTTFKNLFPCYWDFRGNEAQHNEMANNYITIMSNFLKNINTNLPDNVANALAWGGLEKTAIWTTKDSSTIRNILNINNMAAKPTQQDIDSLKLKKCN